MDSFQLSQTVVDILSAKGPMPTGVPTWSQMMVVFGNALARSMSAGRFMW